MIKIGHWLKLNGEAIYGTRPYKVYGEGTFCMKEKEAGKKRYADYLYVFTADDLRFTTKKNTIYVTVMDWPGNGKTIKVKHLNKKETDTIKSVTFVANNKKVKWRQQEDGLYITMPKQPVGEYAYVFKVSL